jgi:hypothetical protein
MDGTLMHQAAERILLALLAAFLLVAAIVAIYRRVRRSDPHRSRARPERVVRVERRRQAK